MIYLRNVIFSLILFMTKLGTINTHDKIEIWISADQKYNSISGGVLVIGKNEFWRKFFKSYLIWNIYFSCYFRTSILLSNASNVSILFSIFWAFFSIGHKIWCSWIHTVVRIKSDSTCFWLSISYAIFNNAYDEPEISVF